MALSRAEAICTGWPRRQREPEWPSERLACTRMKHGSIPLTHLFIETQLGLCLAVESVGTI